MQQTQVAFKYVTAECAVVDANRTPTVDEVIAIVGRYLPEDMARGFAEAGVNNPAGTFVLFTARRIGG